MLGQHILQREGADECEGACSESQYVCELPRMNQQDDVEGYSLTPLCHVVPQCAI